MQTRHSLNYLVKLITFCVVGLACGNYAWAQDGNGYVIKGVVKDKRTGEAVPFATVFFPNSAVGTPAELDGSFELASDTLPAKTIEVKAIGYKPYSYNVDPTLKKVSINIELETEAALLNEVVIRAGEDPAIIFLKNIIRSKPKNDPNHIANYSYEAYTKVEVDLLNMAKEQLDKLPYFHNFSFIYDHQDTIADGRPYLPFFFTEAISDYYFQRQPWKTKEFIKSSHFRGIENESITNYMGKMYLSVNAYDNYIKFLGKQFVSPLNSAGPMYYKYRFIDTQKIEGHSLVRMSFKPLRFGENCFSGTMVIVDSVYALQSLTAILPGEANINFVKNAAIYQRYKLLEKENVWFCVKEGVTAELSLPIDILKSPSLLVHRTMSYTKIKLNEDRIKRIINDKRFKQDVVITDTTDNYSEALWKSARHEPLSKSESAVYNMFDTLEKDPKYARFKNTARFLVTGNVWVGPLELGPYWSLYSTNIIEGNRFRFSMGTNPTLSKNVYLNGYIAYGTKDKRFKYSANMLWLLKRHPRSYINFSYVHDVDHSLNYNSDEKFDNIFRVLIRKKYIPQKFLFTDDTRLEYYREFYNGFSFKLQMRHSDITPYRPLPSLSIFKNEHGTPVADVINTEADLQLRYAWHERFLEGNYYRVSLNSKYPIVEAHFSMGLKNIWNSRYDYKKLLLEVSDKFTIPHLGKVQYTAFAGKYFGMLPYPLLEVHPGNEYYYYGKFGFNMMNRFEFVSDEYAGLSMEHSIGGGVFNYIPGIKKLKLRQFWTARALIGSLSDSNKAMNFHKGFMFRSLDHHPYLELGTGIENIFRVLRVDFVWRVMPRALPNEPFRRFGVFGSLKIDF